PPLRAMLRRQGARCSSPALRATLFQHEFGTVPCSIDQLVARCLTADDVKLSLAAARVHGFQISVRGGGHDWTGRSLCGRSQSIWMRRRPQSLVAPRPWTYAPQLPPADLLR